MPPPKKAPTHLLDLGTQILTVLVKESPGLGYYITTDDRGGVPITVKNKSYFHNLALASAAVADLAWVWAGQVVQ